MRVTTAPVPYAQAFSTEDTAAVQSQAAALILIGHQLARQRVTHADSDDFIELQVPKVRPAHGRSLWRHGLAREQERFAEMAGAYPALAEDLRKDARPATAAMLISAATVHPAELVRVAAILAYLEINGTRSRIAEDHETSLDVLREAVGSDDQLAHHLAAVALARFAPQDPVLLALMEPEPTEAFTEEANTTLLVHGTFARGATWWQPGGDFHTYLRNDVFPDLYGQADRFDWSGGYSDAARALAADDLVEWVSSGGHEGLNVVAHSHGGSVAMLATQRGMQVDKLLLLSCPVHESKYLPDFNNVREVVSVRVKGDIVILADRGRQRFRHPDIREVVLPIWFDHSASREEITWRTHGVPARL